MEHDFATRNYRCVQCIGTSLDTVKAFIESQPDSQSESESEEEEQGSASEFQWKNPLVQVRQIHKLYM